MGLMDKLLGRGKKAAGDMTGDASLQDEGMHQEQEGMAEDRAAPTRKEQAQEAREEAAEHHAEREQLPHASVRRLLYRSAVLCGSWSSSCSHSPASPPAAVWFVPQPAHGAAAPCGRTRARSSPSEARRSTGGSRR